MLICWPSCFLPNNTLFSKLLLSDLQRTSILRSAMNFKYQNAEHQIKL